MAGPYRIVGMDEDEDEDEHFVNGPYSTCATHYYGA